MVSVVEKRLISVDEYYKMAEAGILKSTDRVELIHGDIFDMSPIGSRHASIVDRLAKILNRLFEEEAIIGIQRPIRLDDKNEPEPDISVLQFRADYYVAAHPDSRNVKVIIEVADSSIKYDKEAKIPLYASYGIPIYWIIDIENNCIEEFTNPKESKYTSKQIFQIDDEISLMEKRLKVNEIIVQPKV